MNNVEFDEEGKVVWICPLCKGKTSKEDMDNFGCCKECDNKEWQDKNN